MAKHQIGFDGDALTVCGLAAARANVHVTTDMAETTCLKCMRTMARRRGQVGQRGAYALADYRRMLGIAV